jgi:hypothetical protein
MSNFLHYLALFWIKKTNHFAEFFGENILKIITNIGPWTHLSVTKRISKTNLSQWDFPI